MAFQVAAQGIAVAIPVMYFHAEAMRRLGAPSAAALGALAPGFAVWIGMLFLKEVPAWWTLAAIGPVMGGVALVLVGGRPKQR